MRILDGELPDSLVALGQNISAKRDEAVAARASSGLEDTMMRCEEAYLGIDDANRSEFASAKWAKPTTMEGPIVSGKPNRQDTRSTIFVRLTSRYVDAGAAKLSEILISSDDKAFSISPTPIPTLIAAKEDTTPVTANGQPLTKQTPEGETIPLTVGDLAKAEIEKAQKAAEKAETRIYDELVECGYAGELRKVIHDAARIGVGVLKGPFAVSRTDEAVTNPPGAGIAIEIVQKIVPAAKWVDPWNFFPDPSCGEDIQSGNYVFERDFLTEKMLAALKDQPGYIAPAISKVLLEGPERANSDAVSPNAQSRQDSKNKRFVVWHFMGNVKRTEFEEAVPESSGYGVDGDSDSIFCVITLVNNTPIRVIPAPLQSGDFTYHTMPWTRRSGSWVGVGVGEQVSAGQRMCNNATRAMLNNLGIASGPQIIFGEGVSPVDNSWVITPNKLWMMTSEGVTQDVRQAFTTVQFPSIQPQLMSAIEYAFKVAEDSCNIPLISQGQTGPTTPYTLGATQLQYNNANTLLRGIGHSFDDHITEPLIKQFYKWLLLDPSVPDDEKGDFEINAHGSSAMVDRAIAKQTIQLMGPMVTNPVFGIDPKKWFTEFAKSEGLDPRKLQYTEEEIKAMQEAQQPPPIPIAVAQINAQSREKVAEIVHGDTGIPMPQGTPQETPEQSAAQIRASTELEKARMTQSSDMAELQFKAQQAQLEREHDLAMAQIQFQIKQMEFAEKRGIQLNQVKSQLAQTTMKLNTQVQLSEAAMAEGKAARVSDQVVTPPTEPTGRADDGRAFEQ